MKTIGVLGTGTMATGITQNAAQCGYDVIVRGRSQNSLDECIGGVERNLDRLVTAFERFGCGVQDLGKAALKAAAVFDRINAELGEPLLKDCDECGIAHAADEIFKTTWDQEICRECWSSVTNDAPLPDQPPGT